MRTLKVRYPLRVRTAKGSYITKVVAYEEQTPGEFVVQKVESIDDAAPGTSRVLRSIIGSTFDSMQVAMDEVGTVKKMADCFILY
jgi:hypothetical protein